MVMRPGLSTCHCSRPPPCLRDQGGGVGPTQELDRCNCKNKNRQFPPAFQQRAVFSHARAASKRVLFATLQQTVDALREHEKPMHRLRIAPLADAKIALNSLAHGI